MERLTGFSNIVTTYGHCGTSVMTEAVPHEVESYSVPGSGYKKQVDLHDEYDVQPQNSLTAKEKLETALEMAESIAVLHGFTDGVIVHDDIQLQQWLRARDGLQTRRLQSSGHPRLECQGTMLMQIQQRRCIWKCKSLRYYVTVSCYALIYAKLTILFFSIDPPKNSPWEISTRR